MENTKDKIAAEIAHNLLQIKAIKLNPANPFTWASGIKSPIYCDNRIVLSYPPVRKAVIAAMKEKSAEFTPFQVVAGVATAGIAHGALLAEALDLPFVYVRSKAKGHGRQNQIEGELRGNERVLVIEDLISTGGSSLEAVEVLRNRGCNVAGVLAIFSYGFPTAKAAFEKADCPFATLSNYEALIRAAIDINYIDQKNLESLKEWSKNPREWATTSN